ncbi:MAG TPA: molybdopterin-dependent oxidoreductase [Methanobacterium sp.]|nr:molybdopterin-dependent oxidoreductase [Methanobacterium sp.]
MSNTQNRVKKILRWTLAILTVIVIISGLGITYYTTTSYITAGLLSKTTAFWIHFYLLIPFVILFVLHMFIKPILRAIGRLSESESYKGFLSTNKGVILVILVIMGISVYLIAGQFGSSQPIKLDNVEVKEYKGQKLSSVNDFRENSIKGPQYINESTYRLEVTGLVTNPKNYTYGEVINNHQSYEKVVSLDCVEGWDVTILWQGVLVKDLIRESIPSPNANTVIFYAYDGYSTSFPRDYLENSNILMAYKMNNATIPPQRGFPFQLVAEDKWGYKWIKWITKIELSNNSSYQGYWESRGYSNSGNLNESFLK